MVCDSAETPRSVRIVWWSNKLERRRTGAIMKRILLTGMSGTGKSTLTDELAARGYKAIDLDCDTFSEWVELNGASESPGSPVQTDRDWIWRADRIDELLSTEDADVVILSGCASNM